MELVYASGYDEAIKQVAIKQVAIIERRSDALESIVRFIAHTTPHEGKWEASYLALQDQALRGRSVQHERSNIKVPNQQDADITLAGFVFLRSKYLPPCFCSRK